MADQEKKSAENQPPQQPEASKVENKAEIQPVQPAADRDFNKKVDEKTKEYEEKVEKLKKRFQSQGSIGEKKAELMTAQQINRLRIAAARKKDQFKALAAEEKAQRMSLMLGETEQALVDIYFPYEKIIDYVRGLDKLDETELVRLEAIMEAMVKLKANPVLEKIFMKSLNKEKLDKQDLQTLVDQMSPVNLGQNLEKIDQNQIFESSQIGAIVGVMPSGQRMELVDLILTNKPAQEAMSILDIFLTAGIINNLQLQDLLAKGKIPEPYASQWKQQLEAGQLLKKQQEYGQKIDKLTQVNKGRTAENPLSKTVGGPGLMALTALWGVAVALVNLKVNWNWNKPGEGLANALTNPYFLMGTAAATAGTLSTVSIVAPEKYGHYREKFKDFWAGPEDQKKREMGRREELQTMLDLELKKNPFLMEYLGLVEEFPGGKKKTGLDVIKEIVAEKRAKKQPIDFSYQEILAQSGPKQKELLIKAYGALGSKDINFKDSLRAIMATVTALGIDNSEQFQKHVADTKKKDGVS